MNIMATSPWKRGDARRFYGSEQKQAVFSGLFWDKGLGEGEFFAPNRQVYFTTKTESLKLAEVFRVPWVMVDAFDSGRKS